MIPCAQAVLLHLSEHMEKSRFSFIPGQAFVLGLSFQPSVLMMHAPDSFTCSDKCSCVACVDGFILFLGSVLINAALEKEPLCISI